MSTFLVQVCTTSDGINWVGPTTIGRGVEPAVAITASGEDMVIWTGGAGTAEPLESSVLPPGGTWTSPVVVTTDLYGQSVIATDGVGDAVAAWTTASLGVATASFAG
jgi:hypothetical protein